MPEVKGNMQTAAIAVHAACSGWAMKKAIAMTKAGNTKATMANGHRTSTLVLLEMKPTKNPLAASVMASSAAMATIVFMRIPFLKGPSVIDGLVWFTRRSCALMDAMLLGLLSVILA